MQPTPSQLPRDDAQRPVARNLKKRVLFLFLAVAVVVVLLAFFGPQKQTEAQRAGDSATPPASQQQRSVQGFKNPTQ